MSRSYEAQWDPGRGEVVLIASSGFGPTASRYAITVPAASKEEADEAARGFVRMYHDIEAQRDRGADMSDEPDYSTHWLVLPKGGGHPPKVIIMEEAVKVWQGFGYTVLGPFTVAVTEGAEA